MKAKFGYIGMTADFFHIGHLNVLKECKKHCKMLSVGIMTDACVLSYKHKKPVMNQNQRREIIDSLKIVDHTMFQCTFEFPHEVLRLKEFHGKNFIIFDSVEHCRENADILIQRTPIISSSLYKKYENPNIGKL